jgi:glycosyltransferase involved in cell wall biosynthesis
MVTEEISVVLCTKNEETNIEQCLVGLQKQDLVPEIIVVDGHSTDRTRQIARDYADKILLDTGGGLSEARNIGWKVAQCPIMLLRCRLPAKGNLDKKYHRTDESWCNRRLRSADLLRWQIYDKNEYQDLG